MKKIALAVATVITLSFAYLYTSCCSSTQCCPTDTCCKKQSECSAKDNASVYNVNMAKVK